MIAVKDRRTIIGGHDGEPFVVVVIVVVGVVVLIGGGYTSTVLLTVRLSYAVSPKYETNAKFSEEVVELSFTFNTNSLLKKILNSPVTLRVISI